MKTSDLIAGLATWTADNGIGSWSTEGAYADGVLGIYDTVIPENVDKLITLSGYSVSNDPTLSDSVIGVQVRTRWPGADPRPCRDLDDQIFDLWQGATHLDLAGGVRVVEIEWRSGSTLGQDDNHRWGWTTNYYVTIWRPSINRQ